MKGKMKSRERNPYQLLIGVYIVLVAVRFALALLTSAYPMNNIDEFLYYSMGRSIATGDGLLFRGQSADYVYIVYPLVLSPVYALFGETGIVYRCLQLWNIAIMNLTIFPLYGLVKRITSDVKRAVYLSTCMMFLPDFIMGEMVLSEVVLYPLFFTVMYLTYRYLKEHRWQLLFCVGILGGVLYATKPGYIVGPVVIFIACAVFALWDKEYKGLIYALVSVLCMISVIGAFYALAYALGYRSGALAVYEQQLENIHSDAFLRAAVKYPYYFIMGCGVFAFVLPLLWYGSYAREIKRLYGIVMLSLGGTILGTCWVINGYEYATNTVHMRYISTYIPLMLLFCFAPCAKETPKAKKMRVVKQGIQNAHILPYIAIGFAVLCTLTIGCGAGTDSGTLAISNLSLAILNKAYLPQHNVATGSVLVLILLGVTGVGIKVWRAAYLRRAGLYVLIILFGLSNMAGYSLIRNDTVFSRVDESRMLADQIGDMEYLYVTTSERIINNASLDVNSLKHTNYVELNDLFNHVYEAGGLYKPFVPWAMRGRICDRMTPQTNLLVMEPTAFSMVKLSKNTKHTTTPSEFLHLIEIPQGENWADSIIANVELNKLEAGESGVLYIFSEEIVSDGLTVRMEIEARENASLEFFSNSEVCKKDIIPGRNWYEFTFSNEQNAYNFVCEQQDLTIYGYELISMDE